MRKWILLWKNWPKSPAWVFKALAFVACLSITLFCNAQFVQKHIINHTSEEIAFKSKLDITAIALVTDDATAPYHTLTLDGQKYTLPLDEHAPRPTYFLSLELPGRSLSFTEAEKDMELYTIHSGTPPKVSTRPRSEHDCTEVNAIPQSDWRSGLPAPVDAPTPHTVTHHIVHHTAGSNTNTNYVQVVRDIYLLHTEVNGWSDIGYNFVIAQDGTLFEGRDPGANRTEFEVRGAHFCGKNTGTFGVALLGNFQTAQLTTETRASLIQLLTFSLSELEIDPLSASEHRGETLNAISGHRDGCATLCPGENVYALLPSIRTEVQASIDNCIETVALSFLAPQEVIRAGESITFENTSTGYETYSWRFQGGSPIISQTQTPTVTYTIPGVFDVTLFGEVDGRTDSLITTNFVEVAVRRDTPLLYPNPVSTGGLLEIEAEAEIVNIRVYALSGKLVAEYSPEEGNILQAPQEVGFYTVSIETVDFSISRKLIVR